MTTRARDWNALIGAVIEEAVTAERERCAAIAENVHMHTASQTQERDWAHKILPRVALAIRRKP